MEGDIKNVMKYWIEGEIESFVKLLLLAFDQGPLSDSSLSITKFLFLACLPIKIQQKSTHQNGHSPNLAENISSVQNGKDFAKNVHFQETTFPSFLDKIEINSSQDGHFHETQSKKSDEESSNVQSGKDFARNGRFQETSFPNSVDKIENNPFQDGHFHEIPSEKSDEKGYSVQSGRDFARSGRLQESSIPSYFQSNKGRKLNYGIKVLLFALIIKVYDYSDNIHPYIIMVIYCFHIYLCLDIILAVVSGLARDFWGRRWNLIVTRILRPTVYKPTLSLSTYILGRKWAPLPAVMATFVVSGLMHELIFYYLGRVKPTWEITWFFLLHGVCLNIEICVKKVTNDKLKMPRIIGTILTVGFVMITGFWLFFPQLLRCNADVRALAEYEAIRAFFKDVTRAMNSTFLR
ncbi:unnamed protein product [Withania somnifera]